MNIPTEIAKHLHTHLALCEELRIVVERESQVLRTTDGGPDLAACQSRKSLIPRLEQSLNHLRQDRAVWQRLSLPEREKHPEIEGLLRRNQDLIMKIIVLDRENEQALLRKGLVPTRHLPSAQRQRPHYVADLYRRQGLAG